MGKRGIWMMTSAIHEVLLGAQMVEAFRDEERCLDLPRFRGEMRAWDQALWLDVMLSSGLVAFFGSAPGGAILPSRPAH